MESVRHYPDIIAAVKDIFPSRYDPYDFQREIILKAVELPTSLLKMDVGTGKTIVSWFMALAASLTSGVKQILVLCPPTLIRQWYDFAKEFEHIHSVCAYRGTPEQRKLLDLTEPVIIMGYQIFLKDFDKIYEQMFKRKVYVICDEVELRSIKTKTYKRIRELLYNAKRSGDLRDREEPDKRFTFLNATPISNPAQAYGYIKLLTPETYPNLRYFEYLHVAKKDRYNKAVAYKNLDLLEENFKLHRFDADADELLSLPPITYIPIKYDLDAEHLAIYVKLVNQEISNFPAEFIKNGKEIAALFTRLQQMVTNPDMFGYNITPAYLELLDERLEELGPDEKVIIYAHFKSTNRRILEHLGQLAVGFWSDFSPVQKDTSEDAFRGNVNRMVAHCQSGGKGLNLQYARHEIFVEIPPDPPTFKQAVGRIHRDGQQRKQFVAIFLASGTIQERIYYNLIVKDKLLADVIGDKKSLENFLM